MNSGSALGASCPRAEAGGPAEEGLLQPEADRVRADALRDPDGRHPVTEVQTQQGDGRRKHTPQSQEGRPRRHPRLYQVSAPAQEGDYYIPIVKIDKIV